MIREKLKQSAPANKVGNGGKTGKGKKAKDLGVGNLRIEDYHPAAPVTEHSGDEVVSRNDSSDGEDMEMKLEEELSDEEKTVKVKQEEDSSDGDEA
jgi:hypothetical protein